MKGDAMKLSEFLEDVGYPVPLFTNIWKTLGSLQVALFTLQSAYRRRRKETEAKAWLNNTAAQNEEDTALSCKEREDSPMRLKELRTPKEGWYCSPRRTEFQLEGTDTREESQP